ncbi:sulfite exporter TauE/SafE family protein [Aegicerativicinus sediminis]|uniref:sulfite exporter TauE/SafE family protein n=1 Tax=Aegicerativicinus sediminis TaxID=2893202 RepID=UPI001E4E3737|nr:sulfite exporter TauE/SafE family protein [Aegicerativicinus sediminis]
MIGEPLYLIGFLAILIVVAFLYSSIGHGGASGYLGLMALFSLPMDVMKPSALLLNIVVAGISFWFFRKHKYFKPNLFKAFAISSIPAAFIGGYLNLNPLIYKKILGVLLIFAVLRMINVFGKPTNPKPFSFKLALVIGFCIGLFSGMIGIGGGIILSPIIILLGWGSLKEAAAVSALFIFVNSIAGIIGFSINGGSIPTEAFYFIPFALVGGILGSYYGSKKFGNNTLKYVLSVVLLIASIKLFLV